MHTLETRWRADALAARAAQKIVIDYANPDKTVRSIATYVEDYLASHIDQWIEEWYGFDLFARACLSSEFFIRSSEEVLIVKGRAYFERLNDRERFIQLFANYIGRTMIDAFAEDDWKKRSN